MLVDLIAFGQEFIQFTLAQHGAQRRLGDLLGRQKVVGDVYNRGFGVQYTKVADGIDFDGHVVFGNGLLRRHVQGNDAQVDNAHLVDKRDQPEQAGPFGACHAAQAEDYAAVVLPDDAQGCPQQPYEQENHDDIDWQVCE